MLEQICAFIHNWFVRDRKSGTFTIEDGSITLPFLVGGQYFRIVGSRLNDGVYTYPPTGLSDETFSGEIWDMRPPKDFRILCGEIEQWQERYGGAVESPYQSESVIGVYSYDLKHSGVKYGESSSGWQDVFKKRLNEWRKLA